MRKAAGRFILIPIAIGFIMKIKRKINCMGHQVNRIMLVVLLFSACLSACTPDDNDSVVVQAQLVKDVQLIDKYLQKNNIKANVVDSSGVSTGIYYTIDTAGTANTLFTSSTTITVGYTGWLLTTNATLGPVIATTNQFTPSFVLGSTLEGWQLGIANSGIGTGGAITLYLPSKYAYGPFPQSTLGLPANSVLIFHILMDNVTN